VGRTLKLTVSYDGSAFVGWQRQAAGESIQGLLETALARFEGGPVTVHGAGRTDAGVHALGQVASAAVTCSHDTDVLCRGLNAQLPAGVRVRSVAEAASDFHARFSARSKTYRYLLRNGPLSSPFERQTVWQVTDQLDLDAMALAASRLTGTHDFAAFGSTGGVVTSTVRTLTRSDLVVQRHAALPGVDPAASGRLVTYEVQGDGFLRHMVRAIVGTLVEVGRGGRTAASVAALLDGGSRSEAGATAPAHGLYLVSVDYD
jgi:tRNA pseudouridine38-40 synthase